MAWGVAVGLLAGVVGASVAAMRLRLGTLPEDMSFRYLWGLGALAGIGFTVAFFVADLAFDMVWASGGPGQDRHSCRFPG